MSLLVKMLPQLGFISNDYMEERRWLVQWSTVVVSSYVHWVLLLCRWFSSGQDERCIDHLGRDLYLVIRAAGSVMERVFCLSYILCLQQLQKVRKVC